MEKEKLKKQIPPKKSPSDDKKVHREIERLAEEKGKDLEKGLLTTGGRAMSKRRSH